MKIVNKKKVAIIIIVFLATVSLLIAIIKGVSSGKKKEPTGYLALGDALALGVNSHGLVKESYADYLGEELKEKKVIKNYYKDFTRTNIKSAELLKIIERDALGVIGEKTRKISSLIEEAKIITISVGLQDIMTYFTYSPTDRTLFFQADKIRNQMNIVQMNVFNVIEEIKVINPDAEIFLVGYYFLFPWIISEQRESAKSIFDEINSYYQEIAEDTASNYIDISAVGDQQYLSNMISIYPDVDGYKYIAGLIKENIKI